MQGALAPLPNVKNIIVVASGKGGVGKSTVSVNLALALAAEGAKVGILDADIYGPSQPRMLGISGKPESPDGKTIIPMQAHGLQAMSIGFLVDEETPMIWRGPMVTQAMMQLLNDSRWEQLDYLVVDLPPGTGDIQLTLSQKVPVAGAVIVTTPQDIALLDARKALKMFEKVEVPVLGVVENMATHVCSNCGHEEHIFGEGGGARMADAVRRGLSRFAAAGYPHPRAGRWRHARPWWRCPSPISPRATARSPATRRAGCRASRATSRSAWARWWCRARRRHEPGAGAACAVPVRQPARRLGQHRGAAARPASWRPPASRWPSIGVWAVCRSFNPDDEVEPLPRGGGGTCARPWRRAMRC